MEYVSRYGPVSAGIVPPGAGGQVAFEDYGGISGGSDYHKAYATSMLARFAPDTLAASVRRSWDEPFMEEISPAKPKAVSMVGADVFGPPSFHSTVRNSMLDLRGEAYVGDFKGEAPTGASEVSWAAFAEPNAPSSTGLACGTCGSHYARGIPISNPAHSAHADQSTPRTSQSGNIWSTVKSVFLM
jgi:hypothetical protein